MEDVFVIFAQEDAGGVLGGLIGLLCSAIVWLGLPLVVLWGVFKKAGVTPWWGAVPILNVYGLTRVIRKPGWWVVLAFIPIVGAVLFSIEIAKKFGRGLGTVVGLVLLGIVFLPILGYGSATYDASRTELAS